MKRYLSFMVAFAMILNLMAPAVAATSAKTYKVTVSKTSGGTVDGAGSYEEGDTVVLTAEPKSGYVFEGWMRINGVELEDATEPEVEFEMPANKVSLKATFKKVPTYKVSVSKTSGGTVDGAGSYKDGETVVLSAETKTGYIFEGWTSIKGIEIEDVSEPEITFEMPTNKVSLKAVFTKVPTYKITVSKTSGGTVDGAGSYKEGEIVELKAEPKNGYEFKGWTSIKGIEIEDVSEPEITFEMPTNKISIKAEFAKVANKVTVSKTSGGNVTGAGTYNRGEIVTLKVEPKTGYKFVNWSNLKGIELEQEEVTNPEISFEMPLGVVSIKANFQKVPVYKLTLSKSTGGTVTGAGSYEEGQEITITAEAKDGYKFTGWSDVKGIEIESALDPEITFLMPAGKVSLKANFAKYNSAFEEAWEDLDNLDLTFVSYDGSEERTGTITRAQMVSIVCRTVGVTSSTANANRFDESEFSDVTPGEWYTGWVNVAVDRGLIKANTDEFRPEDMATLNEAIEIIVRALGRGEYVDQNKGDFVKEATRLKITKNLVNYSIKEVTVDNFTILLHNALDVPTWEVKSTSIDGKVTLKEGKSLREKYYSDKDSLDGLVADKEIQIGIVYSAATIRTDVDGVEYMSVGILDTDGSEKLYHIYDPNYKDITDSKYNPGFKFERKGLKPGDIVLFKSTKDRIIPASSITVPNDGAEYSIDYEELFAIELDTAVQNYNSGRVVTIDAEGDLSSKRLSYDTERYRFNSSSTIFNTNEPEIVTNLELILNENDEFAPMTNAWLFTNSNNKIRYFCADISEYHETCIRYGVLKDIDYFMQSKDEMICRVKFFHKGDTYSYEFETEDLCDNFNEGDFVKVTTSNGKIVKVETFVYVEDILDARDYEDISDFVVLAADSPTIKGQIIVDRVEDSWLVFEDDVYDANGEEVSGLRDLELNEDGYIIYDLRGEEPIIADVVEPGDYVLGFDTEKDEAVDILVIVK